MKKDISFWNFAAPFYDIFVNITNSKTNRRLCQEIIPIFQSSDIVLECACGTGMLTEVIAPRCKKIYATDFSKKMVEKTKSRCKRFKNIEYMTADITNLDFENASFDKVIAGNVIHLLEYPKKALQELERVCRPGGIIIIPTYINDNSKNKENLFTKILGKFGIDFKTKFTFESYETFFTDSGYSDTEFIRIEGRIPCSVAIIKKRDS